MARSIWFAALFAGVALAIGVAGYHWLDHLPWVDAILEASMILSGMGPVAPMASDAAKLFASAYALLSGLFIIGATGFILAPWLHRVLHYLHQENPKDPAGSRAHKG
ncbi:MAG TPA: hypothetical protein VK832_07165 [Burkholderiaceae bacterium]|nr:hypothetical protein [Burkholderiaceae bacterium]